MIAVPPAGFARVIETGLSLRVRLTVAQPNMVKVAHSFPHEAGIAPLRTHVVVPSSAANYGEKSVC
jgi:hypothetical protein